METLLQTGKTYQYFFSNILSDRKAQTEKKQKQRE